MGPLYFHFALGIYHRTRTPPVRLHLLPTLRTVRFLVPPISMLQHEIAQHLAHQLPPRLRHLLRYVVKCRLRMLFPPRPHLLKHLLRPAYKFRLRFFSFHHSTPFSISLSFSLISVYPSYTSTKIWDAPTRKPDLTRVPTLCILSPTFANAEAQRSAEAPQEVCRRNFHLAGSVRSPVRAAYALTRRRRSTGKCVSKRMTKRGGPLRPLKNSILPAPVRCLSPFTPQAACVKPPPVVSSLTSSSKIDVCPPCVDRETKFRTHTSAMSARLTFSN